MLLFNAKFAVSKDLSRQGFLDMLIRHLTSSSDYRFELDSGIDVSKELDYEAVSDDNLHKFMLYVTNKHLAVRISRQESSLILTDTYVLADVGCVPVMSVQLDRSLRCPSVQPESVPEIPYVIRNMFWEEYGGVDHDVVMDDKPYRIRKENVEFVESVLANKIELFNPVAYVAVNRDTGEYPVDCYALSSKLVGLAHVFVEGSPYVAKEVGLDRDFISDKGGVFLLFPNGDTYVVHDCAKSSACDGDEVIRQVIEYLYHVMSSVVIEDEFSFSKIETAYLLSKSGSDADLSKVCDALLEDKDAEIAELKKCLSEAKASLSSAESKIDSMTRAFEDSKTRKQDSGLDVILSGGDEHELYTDEFKDVVLKLISREVDSMDSDNKLSTCRKFHVLSSILKANKMTGRDLEISNVFCKAVESGTLTAEKLSEIERLGFSVAKTKNCHFRIAYNGDARYACTVSSTPSDYRAGDNLGKSYMNMLFGF